MHDVQSKKVSYKDDLKYKNIPPAFPGKDHRFLAASNILIVDDYERSLFFKMDN